MDPDPIFNLKDVCVLSTLLLGHLLPFLVSDGVEVVDVEGPGEAVGQLGAHGASEEPFAQAPTPILISSIMYIKSYFS